MTYENRFSYKAFDQDGNIYYLSSKSNLSYIDQVEQEYRVTDNYCIVEECSTHGLTEEDYKLNKVTKTSLTLRDIMNKINGHITKINKPQRQPRKLKEYIVTYSDNVTEIMNADQIKAKFDLDFLPKLGRYVQSVNELWTKYRVVEIRNA